MHIDFFICLCVCVKIANFCVLFWVQRVVVVVVAAHCTCQVVSCCCCLSCCCCFCLFMYLWRPLPAATAELFGNKQAVSATKMPPNNTNWAPVARRWAGSEVWALMDGGWLGSSVWQCLCVCCWTRCDAVYSCRVRMQVHLFIYFCIISAQQCTYGMRYICVYTCLCVAAYGRMAGVLNENSFPLICHLVVLVQWHTRRVEVIYIYIYISITMHTVDTYIYVCTYIKRCIYRSM